MLSRFHLIPERNRHTDRWTDRQTDRFAIPISCVSMLTRDKIGQLLFCHTEKDKKRSKIHGVTFLFFNEVI